MLKDVFHPACSVFLFDHGEAERLRFNTWSNRAPKNGQNASLLCHSLLCVVDNIDMDVEPMGFGSVLV